MDEFDQSASFLTEVEIKGWCCHNPGKKYYL